MLYSLPLEIANDPRLTISQKKVYGYLHQKLQNRESYFSSAKFIGEQVKLSRQTVSDCVNSLMDYGLIVIEKMRMESRKLINVYSLVPLKQAYNVLLDAFTDVSTWLEKCFPSTGIDKYITCREERRRGGVKHVVEVYSTRKKPSETSVNIDSFKVEKPVQNEMTLTHKYNIYFNMFNYIYINYYYKYNIWFTPFIRFAHYSRKLFINILFNDPFQEFLWNMDERRRLENFSKNLEMGRSKILSEKNKIEKFDLKITNELDRKIKKKENNKKNEKEKNMNKKEDLNLFEKNKKEKKILKKIKEKKGAKAQEFLASPKRKTPQPPLALESDDPFLMDEPGNLYELKAVGERNVSSSSVGIKVGNEINYGLKNNNSSSASELEEIEVTGMRLLEKMAENGFDILEMARSAHLKVHGDFRMEGSVLNLEERKAKRHKEFEERQKKILEDIKNTKKEAAPVDVNREIIVEAKKKVDLEKKKKRQSKVKADAAIKEQLVGEDLRKYEAKTGCRRLHEYFRACCAMNGKIVTTVATARDLKAWKDFFLRNDDWQKIDDAIEYIDYFVANFNELKTKIWQIKNEKVPTIFLLMRNDLCVQVRTIMDEDTKSKNNKITYNRFERL